MEKSRTEKELQVGTCIWALNGSNKELIRGQAGQGPNASMNVTGKDGIQVIYI
jgi:hypothetical protein